MEESSHSNLGRSFWVAVAVLTILAVFAGGYGYHRHETERIRQEKYQEIAAIAKLKADQIEQWRRERLGDVQRSSKASFFVGAVRELLRDPDNTALRANIQARLELERKTEGYADVLLLDTEFRVLLSAEPRSHPLVPSAKPAIEQALADRSPVLSNLYRGPNGIVHLDAVGAILDAEGRPAAVLILRSDAESYLFPLIRSWPTASRTGETALVKRDGEDVLYLSDLRHQPGSALSMREPLTSQDLTAVQAVLGKEGIFQGRDYRGVEVLADLRPIPESPWFLVAKVDASEVLAEAGYRSGIVVLSAVLFIVLSASITAYGYRNRQVHLYRDLYRTELERRAAAEELEESRRQAAFFTNLVEKSLQPLGVGYLDGRIGTVNEAFCRLVGYSKDELATVNWATMLTPPEWLETTRTKLAELERTGQPVRYEKEYVRKDGTRVPVEILVHLVSDENGAPQYYYALVNDIPERKRTEEAIRQSEKRFRSLFENMLEGFAYCRMLYEDGKPEDFIYLDVNDAFERLTGLKDVIGRRATEVIPGIKESNPELFEVYGCVSSTGNPAKVETYLAPLEIWFSISVYSTDREHFVAVFDNITERKRSEEALRDSEERFRVLADGAFEGVLISRDAVILDANRVFCDKMGYTLEELVGMSIGDIVPAEFKELTLNHVLSWSEEAYEAALVRKDGQVFPVQVKGKIIPFEGRSARIASVRDITAAKKAEEVQKRLAIAIEQSAEAVLITDTNGIIHYVNPAMERITGFSSEALLGKTPAVFKSDQHDSFFYQQVWETIRAGDVWSGRFTNKRQNGRLFHVDVTISPVRSASGEITNFVAVGHDVTEHLELSSQLFQAQKMEAVGTLAGGVAHDFNNLLQVVLGYSELMLSEEDLPVRCRDDLARINQAARDGAELVRRLLTFSRKTEVSPRPLNLNKQIEQLQKMLSRTLPKMIEIELHLADDLVEVNADPTQIEQVLMNLAVNAMDAMPEGGCLAINTENVTLDESYAKMHLGAKPGRYVLLSVSDTGQGMDGETVQHIFEPFFTTKAPGEGTGLGLAMVYGIIQQHGGYISCYSEPGEGTTFRMYFPALVSTEEFREDETKALPRGGSETILLVDDEELLRDLGSRILTKAGYKVITASNGKEALNIYRAQSSEISLVILDLIMPEMAGSQCLEGLRKLDPTVKVVIASGHSINGNAKETLTSTERAFIRKPYDIREVLEVIRAVLDEEQGVHRL